MGGSAFNHPGPGQPPLNIVRLSAAQYFHLRDEYKGFLVRFYEDLTTAIEAPEKDVFGDIDILASCPRGLFEVSDVAGLLKATRFTRNGPVTSFAIPLRGHDSSIGQSNHEQSLPASPESQPHFQLDITLCVPSLLLWEKFRYSHGDLWNILGSSIRRFGFTLNDRGLYVRILEIEAINRKASLLLLTSDPNEVLNFVGLKLDNYWTGFETVEKLFECAVSSRLFTTEAYRPKELKHNDRQRMRQRYMYRLFVEDWLPKHSDITDGAPSLNRENLLDEALDTFQKRSDYDRIMTAHRITEGIAEMWRDIAAILPLEGRPLNLALRALKRWMWVEDQCSDTNLYGSALKIRATAEMTDDSSETLLLVWRVDKMTMMGWISEHLAEVIRREKARVKTNKPGVQDS